MNGVVTLAIIAGIIWMLRKDYAAAKTTTKEEIIREEEYGRDR